MSLMHCSKGIGIAAVVVAAIGCAGTGGSEVLTYEEFKAQAYREPESGVYVVNGDEPVASEERLREVYAAYLDSAARASDPGFGTAEQELIVNRVDGADDTWSATDAQNLTYCVSLTGFGLNYATVVTALSNAAAAWENVAGVNFTHNVVLDAICDDSTPGVTFDVQPVCSGRYVALAFFPSYPRSQRRLLIDCTGFRNLSPITLTGVMRHELGHVLGFRHEHTRPESGVCFEDNNWRALTAYDSASVMHYPHCNGSQTGDLTLTALDIAGVTALYP